MNNAQRQVIAEKISSTVRILELLELEYEVTTPKNKRRKGNKSPRVVYVEVGKSQPFRIYNSASGSTWANETNGKPVPNVKSIEDLYEYLLEKYK